MATHSQDNIFPLSPLPWRSVAVVGDTTIILLFAALGRRSHGEHNSLPHLLGTAAPFLIGWFAAALALGAYTPRAFANVPAALVHTARASLAGGLIALAIRSMLEHRIVPATFIGIALSFNLALLLGWRSLFTAMLVSRKQNRPAD